MPAACSFNSIYLAAWSVSGTANTITLTLEKFNGSTVTSTLTASVTILAATSTGYSFDTNPAHEFAVSAADGVPYKITQTNGSAARFMVRPARK